MAGIKIDLTGRTFGSLKVLAFAGRAVTSHDTLWCCRCVCGTEKNFRSADLRHSKVKSCGCSPRGPAQITGLGIRRCANEESTDDAIELLEHLA